MEQVRTELKRTGTISLNDTDVRKLAGKPTGAISMADLRGKSNTEQVSNYQIYSNSWRGNMLDGNFIVNFPHKIVSGILAVTSTWKANSSVYRRGYIEILNQRVQQTTKNISISNTQSITGYYLTGAGVSYDENHDIYYDGTVTVDIKFTGEWEL